MYAVFYFGLLSVCCVQLKMVQQLTTFFYSSETNRRHFLHQVIHKLHLQKRYPQIVQFFLFCLNGRLSEGRKWVSH